MPDVTSARPITPPLTREEEGSGPWLARAAPALIAAGILAIYARTFSVPFLFDDLSSITDNRTLDQPGRALLAPPATAGVGGRPLLNLSFALNHAAGGLAVAGYHAVNLAIHLLVAWVLFGVVRRTLLRPGSRPALRRHATVLAGLTAALWAWHPVVTEAVTYVSQRAESLLGLFYLLTVYAYLRYAADDGDDPSRPARRGWAAVSIVACLAGALTKEVIVTAPVLALLFDRTFLSGGFAAAWRRHRGVLVLLAAASWIPVACLMTGLSHRGVGFGGGLGAWGYALGEAPVVVKYVALTFWPEPLVFDYGPATLAHLAEVWPSALAVTIGLGATALALWRRPPLGFFPAAFFLLLAPTSSVVPIVWQPMAESRLYLPLAVAVSGGVAGLAVLAPRRGLLVGAAAALAVLAAARNRAYASGLALWADTVAKAPANPRARNYYGDELAKVPGRLPDALAQYAVALRLQPDFPEAHNNLGAALEKMPGERERAIAEFAEAVRERPGFALAHYNLAATLAAVPGRLPDAIAEYRAALQLEPDLTAAHYNLATALEQLGGHDAEAMAEYEAAIRQQPRNAAAHAGLARSLAGAGRRDAALAEYRESLRLRPDDAAVHFNFANALRETPAGLAEAIAEYRTALQLRPGYVEAHNNLGTALNSAGRPAEARAQFEAALAIDPAYIPAHLNDAVALMKTGDSAGAVAQLEAVLRVDPRNEPARQMLAQLGVAP